MRFLFNSRFFSQLSLAISLFSTVSFNVFAQSNSNNNNDLTDATAKKFFPAPPYQANSWNYMIPPLNATTIPTIDRAGAYYLPYLPHLDDNVGLLVNYMNFFYQQAKGNVSGDAAYKSAQTMQANKALYDTRPQTQLNANSATASALQTTLSNSNIPALKLKNSLVQLPGTDLLATCKPNDIVCSEQRKKNPPNQAFDADTLLGTNGYSVDPQSHQNSNVSNLITFLTNGIDPLPPLPGKPDLSNLNVQKYILQSRALAAAESLSASNFNYLAQERAIVSGLGTQAGITELPTEDNAKVLPDASQLQLEEFLINRRLANQSWYTAVNTAPSIAVQRETLFVLAEMNQQLFQLRMLNERLLATLSTMQTQMTQFNKTNLTVLQQTITANKNG